MLDARCWSERSGDPECRVEGDVFIGDADNIELEIRD